MEKAIRPEDNKQLKTAKRVAEILVDEHTNVAGIVAFGSSVRGNCLPNSDVDVLCIVENATENLKWVENPFLGLHVDLDCRSVDAIDVEAIVNDPYQFGLFRDVLVLYEKANRISELIAEIHGRYTPEVHKRNHTLAIAEDIVKNYRIFCKAASTGEKENAIRGFMFSLWCFSEYMLVLHDCSPGGLRCLCRLKVVHPDSYIEILHIQNVFETNPDSVRKAGEKILDGMRNDGWITAIEKAEWMFRHGFSNEAFHIVGIMAGLRAKDNKLPKEAAEIWYSTMEWTTRKLCGIQKMLEDLFEKYNIAV